VQVMSTKLYAGVSLCAKSGAQFANGLMVHRKVSLVLSVGSHFIRFSGGLLSGTSGNLIRLEL
ncbi:MAG: hypothetical protein P8Y45_23530, partial [Exilibacterium sp.]